MTRDATATDTPIARRSRAAALAIALLALACPGPRAAAQDQGIFFAAGCEEGERLRIAAVGDLLFHGHLQKQALAHEDGFAVFWKPVEHVLRSADIAYANLEGPAARNVMPGGRDRGGKVDGTARVYDRAVYAGGEDDVLVFNFHPAVVPDTKAGGFTIVSTANNHSADRGSLGIERTIEALEAAGLPFAGTRTRAARDEGRRWRKITRARGFSVAWIACTYGLNGLPDRERLVLACHERDGAPSEDVLDEVRAAAAEPGIDAVVLAPHWGVEYQPQPAAQDRRLAREAVLAGATLVVGAHPHVLQPWERIVAPDGREGLVLYSLGNFISAQFGTPRRSAAIALVELARGADGRARLAAAGYVPTWVAFGRPYRVVENTGAEGKESRDGLDLALRVLPPRNRMRADDLATLPRRCPG
ncbi:MAG: CapA family protein [Alphaproteobacteria bacterium]